MLLIEDGVTTHFAQLVRHGMRCVLCGRNQRQEFRCERGRTRRFVSGCSSHVCERLLCRLTTYGDLRSSFVPIAPRSRGQSWPYCLPVPSREMKLPSTASLKQASKPWALQQRCERRYSYIVQALDAAVLCTSRPGQRAVTIRVEMATRWVEALFEGSMDRPCKDMRGMKLVTASRLIQMSWQKCRVTCGLLYRCLFCYICWFELRKHAEVLDRRTAEYLPRH